VRFALAPVLLAASIAAVVALLDAGIGPT